MKTPSKYILQYIENKYKKNIVKILPGEIIRFYYSLEDIEKQSSLFQEGLVIALRHSGLNKSFSLRRLIKGNIVDQTFLMHSPKIKMIVKKNNLKIRRSKLNFLKNF
jgi:large subunit ribosomal protein L19